ncbi:helix-hairpin-helix domain-containing protein [Myxococcus sp. RHSTA-1-4]|uniref:ComEA family DNA-binding protein n=1 Tax=Myxococcus sp. RHSTA-1-4 TaxID=2874601 RepID=UPI001CBC14C5|nr:helix-hairpin-helix domain-containing protein [Myxococcus sp. RHSTA-1-4]
MRALWAVALGLLLCGPGVAEAGKLRTQYTGTVNLNEATAEQLDLLPGVGEKAAQRIIEHRKKRPFQRVEELVRVKGFGKKKFLKLKAHLALAGPTTLRVEQVIAPERKEVAETNKQEP